MTHLSFGTTTQITHNFSIPAHLVKLQQWQAEYDKEVSDLGAIIDATKDDDVVGLQISEQLKLQLPRLTLHRVLEPLELDLATIDSIGHVVLEQNFRSQYAALSKANRLMWLNNLDFIMLPDYRCILSQIEDTCNEAWSGNQMNYLLSGIARIGKTRLLDWLLINNKMRDGGDRNIVPIVYVEAPISARNPQITLLKDMITSLGRVYHVKDREAALLRKMAVFFYQCRVKLLLIDEVHRFRTPVAKHSLIEFSNRIRDVPIVCASCEPERFTEDEPEIQGRWHRHGEIKAFAEERLFSLLAFVDILLPFVQPSYLAFRRIGDSDTLNGPAQLIEERTGGRLGFIMWLIRKASLAAINRNLPCLTARLLKETWDSRPSSDPLFGVEGL